MGFLLSSNPPGRGAGSDVDDVVGDSDQFFVVAGTDDARPTVRMSADHTALPGVR